MHQFYKIRIYPNTKQKIALAKKFGLNFGMGNYLLKLAPSNNQITENELATSCIHRILPALNPKYFGQTLAYFSIFTICYLKNI